MKFRLGVLISTFSMVAPIPRVVLAQAAQPLPGRFELAIGAQWIGPSSLGAKDATLTMGTGTPFTLFKTSSSFGGAPGFEARLGVRVRPQLEGELFGSYAKPAIDTVVTNDAENAMATTASESVKQFVVGGGVLWFVPRVQSPRLRPFVIGGAAYVRQLHEADTLAANGMSIDVGGGAKYVLYSRRTGRLRSAGLRADARLQTSIYGVSFTDGAHYRAVVTGSAFFRY